MKKLISVLLALALMLSAFCVGAFADIEGEPQHSLDIILEGNASTGYTWTVSISDESVVYVQDLGVESAEDILGAPGEYLFRICGSAAGSADITFAYLRVFEDTEPVISFTVPVTVDDALNVTASSTITLPCDEASGWAFGMEQGILEITDNGYEEGVGQVFDLAPAQDGMETLDFTLYSAEGKEPGAFTYHISVWDGNMRIDTISYSRQSVEADVPFMPEILFTTTDLEGNDITEQILAGHSLTILNFWEPWCGPCVAEMPYLEQLSQEYADRGLQILGVYASPDSEDDVAAVLEKTGVTYPILHYVREFGPLQTGYVPTTVVFNASGLIVAGPFAGAMNYASWCAMVEDLL